MAGQSEVAILPIGLEGLTGNRDLASLRPTQLIQAFNVHYQRGPAQKEGGSEKYNSSAISGAPKVLSAADWHPTEGTQRLIVYLDDGTVKRDTGAGTFATTLASGLTVARASGVFVEGGQETLLKNKKLFLFTGENAVQRIDGDGTSMAAITTPPVDWAGAAQPICGAVHEGRLWGAYRHRVYSSKSTDHEDFIGGDSVQLPIHPGVGDEIKAMWSFKGGLVIFKKPRGIYLLDTSDSDTTKWRVLTISEVIGIAGPHSGTPVDNDIAFLDPGGEIYLLSAVDAFGNLGTRSFISDLDLDDIVHSEFNFPEQGSPHAIYYTDKRQLMWALPGPGATQNTRIWMFDFNGRSIRSAISTKDTPVTLFLRSDANAIPKPAVGDDAGFIWDLDQDGKSRDGSGYEAKLQTPQMDFSDLDPILGTIRKNGVFLELVAEPLGDWTVSVDVLWDGEITDTLFFNMGSDGAALGTFTLGTHALGGNEVINRKKKLKGSGRRLSLIFRNSGNGQDFSISRAFVHFTRGGDKI